MNMEQVWEEYNKGIYAFLISRISDPSYIDDLMQELWLKIFKNLHTLKTEGSVKSWIYQIAYRTIVDFYRQKGKMTELHGELYALAESEPEAAKELARCIIPFIGKLPKDEAALLMAVDIEGISQKAYAKSKGIKYSTLKSRVQKSRQKLRGIFEDCCKISLDTKGGIIHYCPNPSGGKKC